MNYAVIGAGFGDEGKGVFVDYLCSRSLNPIVVRFSGGQQAGHTVYLDDKKHVFSNFGSGTLRGAPTYWMDTCTFDPVGYVRELRALNDIGIMSPQLFVHANAPVTTPFEKAFNQDSDDFKHHGTCGVGVGQTFQREEDMYSLTFKELYNTTVLNIKLPLIIEYYKTKYGKYYSNIDLSEFIDAVYHIQKSVNIICVDDVNFSNYSDVIFEGSQGLLLDQNIGFFPHVTRSNTGIKNIAKWIDHCYYLTRAYQTRHGAGPMSMINVPHNIKINAEETNILNHWQGEFKRAILDIDLLLYGIGADMRNNKTGKISSSVVVSCLDHVENDLRLNTNGIKHHTTIEDFLSRINTELLHGVGINITHTNNSPYSRTIKNHRC